MHTCCYYSDPYVKMSFRGPFGIFPYFTSFYNDPVPDHYKTKTIPKVSHFNLINNVYFLSVDIGSKVEF